MTTAVEDEQASAVKYAEPVFEVEEQVDVVAVTEPALEVEEQVAITVTERTEPALEAETTTIVEAEPVLEGGTTNVSSATVLENPTTTTTVAIFPPFRSLRPAFLVSTAYSPTTATAAVAPVTNESPVSNTAAQQQQEEMPAVETTAFVEETSQPLLLQPAVQQQLPQEIAPLPMMDQQQPSQSTSANNKSSMRKVRSEREATKMGEVATNMTEADIEAIVENIKAKRPDDIRALVERITFLASLSESDFDQLTDARLQQLTLTTNEQKLLDAYLARERLRISATITRRRTYATHRYLTEPLSAVVIDLTQ
jgi:NACalpha-BTF3-like transcription factor